MGGSCARCAKCSAPVQSREPAKSLECSEFLGDPRRVCRVLGGSWSSGSLASPGSSFCVKGSAAPSAASPNKQNSELVSQDPLAFIPAFPFHFQAIWEIISALNWIVHELQTLKELVWGRKWEKTSVKQGASVEPWALPSAGITSGSVSGKDSHFPPGHTQDVYSRSCISPLGQVRASD